MSPKLVELALHVARWLHRRSVAGNTQGTGAGRPARTGPRPPFAAIGLLALGGAVFGCAGSLALLGWVVERLGEIPPRPGTSPGVDLAGALACCFAPSGLLFWAAAALYGRGTRTEQAGPEATTTSDPPRTAEPPGAVRRPDTASALPRTVVCTFCAFAETRDAPLAHREKCPRCRAPLREAAVGPRSDVDGHG